MTIRDKRRVDIYHQIRGYYQTQYNFVFSSKSNIADLVILGIDKDRFIKLVFAEDKINIDQLKERIKSKVIWRPLKSEYILYIYDKNYKEINKEIILL